MICIIRMNCPSGQFNFPSDNVAFLYMVSLNVMFVTQALMPDNSVVDHAESTRLQSSWLRRRYIAITHTSRCRMSALFLPLIPNACALGTAFTRRILVSGAGVHVNSNISVELVNMKMDFRFRTERSFHHL